MRQKEFKYSLPIHVADKKRRVPERLSEKNREQERNMYSKSIVNNYKVGLVFNINKKSESEEVKEEVLYEDLPHCSDQLPRVHYTGKGTDVECRICLIDFNDNDSIIYLPCFHFYHDSCILDWINRAEVNIKIPTCPVCQESIYGSKVNEVKN
jgi:hypothetical protein